MFPEKQKTRGFWANIRWLGMLFLMCLAFIFGILAWADVKCRSDIEAWVPYYPNAEVISTEYTLVRPRAYGTSHVVLSSPDDEETIRQFYRDNTLAVMQSDVGRGLAVTDWHVEANPEGDDTLIYLFSTCGE